MSCLRSACRTPQWDEKHEQEYSVQQGVHRGTSGIRASTGTMSLFSTLAQFGTPEDIAVAELKIELMFPADDATRDALLAMQPLQ